MPGPPPKLQVRRRNERSGVMVLPAGGRKGRAPKWPLGEPTLEERRRWAELWRTPQAVAWEELGAGCGFVVARFVRVLLAAEQLNKDAMAEARQLEDRLGLTPKAMRLLLWTIGPEASEAAPLRVVDDRWRNSGEET